MRMAKRLPRNLLLVVVCVLLLQALAYADVFSDVEGVTHPIRRVEASKPRGVSTSILRAKAGATSFNASDAQDPAGRELLRQPVTATHPRT